MSESKALQVGTIVAAVAASVAAHGREIRGSTHQVRSLQLANLLPISGKRAAKAEAKKD